MRRLARDDDARSRRARRRVFKPIRTSTLFLRVVTSTENGTGSILLNRRFARMPGTRHSRNRLPSQRSSACFTKHAARSHDSFATMPCLAGLRPVSREAGPVAVGMLAKSVAGRDRMRGSKAKARARQRFQPAETFLEELLSWIGVSFCTARRAPLTRVE
jgi:hypothetical protein